MSTIKCSFCRHAEAGIERCLHCGNFTCMVCHHGQKHIDLCVGVRRELPPGKR